MPSFSLLVSKVVKDPMLVAVKLGNTYNPSELQATLSYRSHNKVHSTTTLPLTSVGTGASARFRLFKFADPIRHDGFGFKLKVEQPGVSGESIEKDLCPPRKERKDEATILYPCSADSPVRRAELICYGFRNSATQSVTLYAANRTNPLSNATINDEVEDVFCSIFENTDSATYNANCRFEVFVSGSSPAVTVDSELFNITD